MINGRLINELENSKKYIGITVLVQWISLLFNILFISTLARFIQDIYYGGNSGVSELVFITVLSLFIKVVSNKVVAKMVYKTSEDLKGKLRGKLYRKLVMLGISYNKEVGTSEAIQLGTEGIEQLEIYFGRYLPQLFYSVLAPITLFAYISTISIKTAVVLLICVPLIPLAIVAIQKVAKKMFRNYWGDYTDLSQNFLENIQGLTTLKIYNADEYKNEQMNEKAEKFRKSTMRVLYMQLNSIILMDFIAFGGAALGIIFSMRELFQGNIGISGALAIILLSAEFFIPLRLLGSFFHIAMNGMAASDQIFRVLDIEEDIKQKKTLDNNFNISISNLDFSYTADRMVLKDINIDISENSFVSIVGESGCGKSTIASLIMKMEKDYKGRIEIGGIELSDISERSIMDNITIVKHDSYIFKGTARENLLMAKPDASEEEMKNSLEKVNMLKFLNTRDGLNTEIKEHASNLSGGQKQRLAIARALLHDTPIYIFDEASSNVDAESEDDIIRAIYSMAKNKTIIFISHRLANVVNSDKIYLLKEGRAVEKGSHQELISLHKEYYRLYNEQLSLENYTNCESEARKIG